MSERFPDLPDRMKRLPVDHRGFPVPWFVAWQDGKPIFPAMDGAKLVKAHREDRCWVCGEKLGRFRASVIGPMCAVNRTISEPPSHVECAQFSARNCPFLANPRMKRVPVEKIGVDGKHSDTGILRNPGATCVWVATQQSKPFRAGNQTLFNLPDPARVEWYANGREATRAEVLESIDSGLPLLRATCDQESTPARRQLALDALDAKYREVLPLLPAA